MVHLNDTCRRSSGWPVTFLSIGSNPAEPKPYPFKSPGDFSGTKTG
jgi:hypothetical protein